MTMRIGFGSKLVRLTSGTFYRRPVFLKGRPDPRPRPSRRRETARRVDARARAIRPPIAREVSRMTIGRAGRAGVEKTED
jgi:hypothetical protein